MKWGRILVELAVDIVAQCNYCGTMKALRDEPDDTIKSESEVKPEVEGTGEAEVNKSVGVDKADVGRGVGQAECRSITLHGCGDQSGRDINNAMSLDRFYGRMLAWDYERRSEQST